LAIAAPERAIVDAASARVNLRIIYLISPENFMCQMWQMDSV
jgi:hypothetical protein